MNNRLIDIDWLVKQADESLNVIKKIQLQTNSPFGKLKLFLSSQNTKEDILCEVAKHGARIALVREIMTKIKEQNNI